MYRFFIGSNNQTGELERTKIESIFTDKVDGFTIYEAQGLWRGTRENSAIVEVENINEAEAQAIARQLRGELFQQAIGLQELAAVKFI